jgi:hypothetical protein
METNDIDTELRKLFGPLMGILNRLAKCQSQKIPKEIIDQSRVPAIRLNIFSYPIPKAEAYLDEALEKVKLLRDLGDRLYEKLIDEYIEGGAVDEETGYPEDYDNITESKANAVRFLNFIETELTLLKDDLLKEKARKSPLLVKKEVKRATELSFKYKYLNQRPADINTLYNKLVKADLISADSQFTDFKKIFSGDAVSNPVTWIGSQSELFHFIKQIHNVNKSVESRINEIWKITTHCFLNKEGIKYSINWRSQKAPASSDRRAMIDRIAASLKS